MEKHIIEVDERLPLLPTIPLSLQHLFAMFGSTVLVPFLLNVDPATCLFMNGIGTLIYLTICKWRLPAYLGSSFAFISPVLAVTSTAGMSYADAQGGFIAFGLCFMLLAFIVKKAGVEWIDVLFPPAAMGSIVAIIGLELAPLAMSMSGFIGDPQGMSASTAIIISMFTLIVTILATVLGRGFIAIIPILIGVIAGYLLSIAMGVVDFTHIEEVAWFAPPTFYAPAFNFSAIMMILPAIFVVFAEHLGHLFVTSDIVGRDLIKDPGLHRSLFADGLSNMISGFVGSTPNTTYGENMGVMAMTGVYSTWVIGGAAVFAIIFSFIGKIAAIIHAIPRHGRRLHPPLRLHRSIRHPHAHRKESRLHQIQEPHPDSSHHDQRPLRRHRRHRTHPAQRHGPRHRSSHDRLPLLPLLRQNTHVQRKLTRHLPDPL